MSEILKDRAIVLRAIEYGETSLIVTALMRRGGRAGFLARGARKPGNRMSGRFRTGNIGDIVYYRKEGRDLHLVKEFSSEPPFDTEGADLEKLCLFQAGLEIAGRSSTGDEQEGRVFDLVEGFIGELAGGTDPWTAFFALETGLLGAAGLMPSLSRCDGCEKVLAECGFTLNPSSGAVECEDCASGAPLSEESCEMLRRMLAGGFENVRDISPGADSRREIGVLLHRMMMHHMEGYRLPGSLGMLKGAIG